MVGVLGVTASSREIKRKKIDVEFSVRLCGNIQYIEKQPHFATIFRFRLTETGRHLQHQTGFLGSKYTSIITLQSEIGILVNYLETREHVCGCKYRSPSFGANRTP